MLSYILPFQNLSWIAADEPTTAGLERLPEGVSNRLEYQLLQNDVFLINLLNLNLSPFILDDRDPTETDDQSLGYMKFSTWVNQNADPVKVFICVDNTNGSAEWVNVVTDTPVNSDEMVKVGGTLGIAAYLSTNYFNRTVADHISPKQIIDDLSDNSINTLSANYILNNFKKPNYYINKSIDPVASDDVSKGHAVGDVWITTANKVFICYDNTVTAAVWACISEDIYGKIEDNGSKALLDENYFVSENNLIRPNEIIDDSSSALDRMLSSLYIRQNFKTKFPVLGEIQNTTVNEGEQALVYVPLINRGEGTPIIEIDAVSISKGITLTYDPINPYALITWDTLEEHGPSNNTVTISTYSSLHPSIVDVRTFIITVNEVNVQPIILADDQKVLNANITNNVTINVFDPDIPVNNINFSIDSTSQSLGMSITKIDNHQASLSWNPGSNYGTYNVIITAAETDTQELYVDNKTMELIVADPTKWCYIYGGRTGYMPEDLLDTGYVFNHGTEIFLSSINCPNRYMTGPGFNCNLGSYMAEIGTHLVASSAYKIALSGVNIVWWTYSDVGKYFKRLYGSYFEYDSYGVYLFGGMDLRVDNIGTTNTDMGEIESNHEFTNKIARLSNSSGATSEINFGISLYRNANMRSNYSNRMYIAGGLRPSAVQYEKEQETNLTRFGSSGDITTIGQFIGSDKYDYIVVPIYGANYVHSYTFLIGGMRNILTYIVNPYQNIIQTDEIYKFDKTAETFVQVGQFNQSVGGAGNFIGGSINGSSYFMTGTEDYTSGSSNVRKITNQSGTIVVAPQFPDARFNMASNMGNA